VAWSFQVRHVHTKKTKVVLYKSTLI
jgi:hypothetical protein